MVIKLAAVQMCSGVSPERNAADMSRLVRDAEASGARKKVYNLKTARDFVLEDVPGHGAGGVTA